MDDQILEIIGKLIAAGVLAVVTYVAKYIKEYLKEKKLQKLIDGFVKGAEQLYHDVDIDGAKRSEYVQEQLTDLGYEITNKIMTQIEGAVWEVNNQNKKNIPKIDSLDFVPFEPKE